jgi:iron complex transport system ATP-binding protein
MPTADPLLHARDLSIGYAGGGRRANRLIGQNLDLSLYRGELTCLLGSNGIGKSTLLRTLSATQPSLAGQVLLAGHDIHALSPNQRARLLGLVLTERPDVGLLSARQVVALGRHPYTDWSGRLTPADDAIVEQAIAMVGAASLAERYLHQLSDGERQRVMIARALAQQPALIILDEPTAYLDLPRRAEMMAVLRQVAHQANCAILLSTHDLEWAMNTADRLWLMRNQAGLAEIAAGAPEDLVLSGAFERTFATEGLVFDRQTGTFAPAQRQNGPRISLVAANPNSLTAIWTLRALGRAGYLVEFINYDQTTKIAGIIVELKEIDSFSTVWRVRRQPSGRGSEVVCDSLLMVLVTLRSQLTVGLVSEATYDSPPSGSPPP